MSFVSQGDIKRLIEGMTRLLWQEVKSVTLPSSFRSISYYEAMQKVCTLIVFRMRLHS
jgi:aspartyl-tRNA synthetase